MEGTSSYVHTPNPAPAEKQNCSDTLVKNSASVSSAVKAKTQITH